MIDFQVACAIAKEYFWEKQNISGLSKALENSTSGFFSGGIPDQVRVGSTIIAVRKNDGFVNEVEIPSSDNIIMLKAATPVDLPIEHIGE